MFSLALRQQPQLMVEDPLTHSCRLSVGSSSCQLQPQPLPRTCSRCHALARLHEWLLLHPRPPAPAPPIKPPSPAQNLQPLTPE